MKFQLIIFTGYLATVVTSNIDFRLRSLCSPKYVELAHCCFAKEGQDVCQLCDVRAQPLFVALVAVADTK